MTVQELRASLRGWLRIEHQRAVDEQRQQRQLVNAQRRYSRQHSAANLASARAARRRLKRTRTALHVAQVAVAKRRRDLRHALPGRARTLAWCAHHINFTEHPAGSNRGSDVDQVERRFGFLGVAWCGLYAGNALLAGGVRGVNSRIASVGFIEDDARARRAPFSGWSGYAGAAKPGDLVVLFGYGVHTGVVESVDHARGEVHTYEGNTSFPGAKGSQSNGGCATRRTRSFAEVRGVAHVNY